MIDRRIAKFKLRRGTDAQRQTVVFDEGELIYVTDSQRIYVGTGEPTLSGGVPVASVVKYTTNKPPAIHSTGDLYYQENLGKLFIYNNENYSTFVGPYGDDTSITFNGNSKFTIASGGVVPSHLNSLVVNASGGVGLNSSGLYVNYDPSTLQIDGSNRLAVIPGLITAIDPLGGIVYNPLGAAVNADKTTIVISPSNIVSVGSISANNISTSAVEITKLHTNVVEPNAGLKISVNGLNTNHDNNTLKIISGKLAVDLSVLPTVVGVPAGTIIYTACVTPPDGYLACDGTKVSLETYPGLSAIYVGDALNIVGSTITYGKKYINSTDTTPNAAGTWISLPDLRGEFVRGWDNGKGTDSGRAYGTLQLSQNLTHTHGVSDPGHSHTYLSKGSDNPAYNAWNGYAGVGMQPNPTSSSGTGISIAAAGGGEARPRNIALLACIKT